MNKYVFFWGGPFSQWAKSPFTIDGITFNTCEQYMMYRKAMLFEDTVTAQAILANSNPREQKMLGRSVKNFDDVKWMGVAYDIVVEANRAKFDQHKESLDALKATRGKTLVEASPYDKRWGIGMEEGDEGIDDPANWQGENLLGKAITQVRIEIFGD